MITPRGTFQLLGVTTFLVLGGLLDLSHVRGAENSLRRQQRLEDTRVAVDHAHVRRPSSSDTAAGNGQRRTMVAQSAASGASRETQSAASGRQTVNEIRPVGFLESYGAGAARSGCGPVCDCGDCDPVCGIEPVCGTDVYLEEPGCGVEIGCGIGSMMQKLGPACDPVCGVDGCVSCGEAVCGVEQSYIDGPGCGMDIAGDCGCDACTGGCDVDCVPVSLPLFRINWNRFQFFTGYQGFKGPLSYASTSTTNSSVRKGTGSFGFHQGFNESRSLKKWLRCDLAAQLGLRATQNNLSGSEFTTDRRYQVFLTYGLFRRVDYGMQYGVVLDYLNDDWYFQADLLQLRGEVSWKSRGCRVFGFQFMAPLNNDTSSTLVLDDTDNVISSSIAFKATDQYRFFYRHLLKSAGSCDAFLGWTGHGDGIIGSTLSLPVRRNLVVQTGSTYLIPREGRMTGGNREEGWNLSLSFVYRPGGPTGCGRYCRPLFDVADNGTFMTDLR